MTIEGLGYLVEPNNQFVRRDGSPIVAGIVRVYYAGTDDVAKTYSDFNGTRNPANIRLDNNGRAIIIADVTKAYRVEVCNPNGGLLWTVEPAYCIGGSGGGGGGGGGSSVPLVRVKFQNGAWSKISGDDGFIKNNPYGTPSLYLPEYGWWWFHTGISVSNPTPRDLIQHLQLKWTRYGFIEEGLPPAFYDEPNLPSLTYEADFTRSNTNNRSGTSLYEQNTNTNHWFGVSLTAYNDTLPNDLEYVIWVELFKVRDA